jgi:dolichol-phosphate mannosyltransferase
MNSAGGMRLLTPDPIARVAAILPCFRSRDQVSGVIARFGPEIDFIICVDDACPQETGKSIVAGASDPRVEVLFHSQNQGVGGAVCTGYRRALELGADICVKIDSDGQMAPEDIPMLLWPIQSQFADYTKGNRFFNLADVQAMPRARLLGNTGLSFLTKLSSGYWNIFDPTNGFTAVHARVLERMPLDKIAKRYFFESDFLFRLGTLRARVLDVPIQAIYGDEVSGLKIGSTILPFFKGNLGNFMKRVFYNYFLRDFSAASLYILLSLTLLTTGALIGGFFWWRSAMYGLAATSGQVMFAALPVILGVQFTIAFVQYDAENTPSSAIHPLLLKLRARTVRRELSPAHEAGRGVSPSANIPPLERE